METWVKIKGFENYEVSGSGHIKNTATGEILKPTLNTWGYPSVTLCCNGKRKNLSVHRLVAKAFIPNPNNLPEVNHKDENKTNNAVWNLEWTTKKENINHGTRTQRANEKKHKRVVQYSLSGEVVKVWDSVKEAEQYGFHHSAISACCHGKRKSHLGFTWGWA
jgi:hypothetical protein